MRFQLSRAFPLTGCGFIGERAGARTRDLLIKSQLLYHLSYALDAGPKTGLPEWRGPYLRGSAGSIKSAG